jgi:hypothetical protein
MLWPHRGVLGSALKKSKEEGQDEKDSDNCGNYKFIVLAYSERGK